MCCRHPLYHNASVTSALLTHAHSVSRVVSVSPEREPGETPNSQPTVPMTSEQRKVGTVEGLVEYDIMGRELDNEHVLQLMKNFYTSQNQNDKIEWVGWMCDKSDKVGYTEDLGLEEEDDELLVPPPFCKKEVVQEFVDKWKAAGLINPEGRGSDPEGFLGYPEEVCCEEKLKEDIVALASTVDVFNMKGSVEDPDWEGLMNLVPELKAASAQKALSTTVDFLFKTAVKQRKIPDSLTQQLHQWFTAAKIRHREGKPYQSMCFEAVSDTHIGNARIIEGDMFALTSLLTVEEKFDCLYADLPYNISLLEADQTEINEEKIKGLLNQFSVVGNSDKMIVIFHLYPSQYNMLFRNCFRSISDPEELVQVCDFWLPFFLPKHSRNMRVKEPFGMGNVFGEEKSVKEIVKEQQRMVRRSIRALERERQGLERQEQKLVADIKQKAKAGQIKSVKIMAKDLVRLRKHQEKFLNLTSQLQAINLQMTTMSSQQALVTSMKQATKAMTRLNRQVKLPALQQTMMEFQRENEKMELQGEMIGEAIDDAMEEDEDEEEEEQIVNQVLDEIGINLDEALVSVPGEKQMAADKAKLAQEDQALEDRLSKLQADG
eukprot:g18532.t1